MKADGIYKMTREEYDALHDRVNYSRLKLFAKSPAHYRHALLEPQEDTDPKKQGRAIHLAAFEPEEFRARCVVWDLGARRGKEYAAFCARHQGKEILTEHQHAVAMAVSTAARADKHAAKYLSGGKGELTVLWTYKQPAQDGMPGFEIRCKSRLDFSATMGALADLKSSDDASLEGFGRTANNLGYCDQAAMYTDAWLAVAGELRPYALVAAETKPPYVVQVHRLSAAQIQLGRDRYRSWMWKLNECNETGNWHGYVDGEAELTLPAYAMPNEDTDGLGLEF